MRKIIIYLEIFYYKFLKLFGYKHDESVIPPGHYCYMWDSEREKIEPAGAGSFWIIPCKYYRNLKNNEVGCILIEFVGWSPTLSDQCKDCNINM